MSRGTLDEAFGLGGGVLIPIPGVTATAIAVTPSGRIIVAGNEIRPENGDRRIVLAALLGNGTLDPQYGQAGILALPTSLGHSCSALAIQDDGSVFLARKLEDEFVASILHIDACGARVSTCGLDQPTSSASSAEYARLVLTKLGTTVDRKIIAAGSAAKQDHRIERFALARFLPDGTLDTRFGRKGITTTDFAGRRYVVSAILPCSDGSILTAGTIEGDQSALTAVLRYDADGKLDDTFGQSGMSWGTYGGTDGSALTGELLLSGDVLIAGNRKIGHDELPAYAAYRPDGRLNTSYAAGGIGPPNPPHLTGCFAAIGVGADGRVVLAGRLNHLRGCGVGIVQLDIDGTLDSSFGVGGFMTIQLSGNGGSATALTIDPEGGILLAAETGEFNGLIVMRLLMKQQRQAGPSSIVTYRSTDEVRSQQADLLKKIQHDHEMAMSINRNIR